jgi:hypothetical protein
MKQFSQVGLMKQFSHRASQCLVRWIWYPAWLEPSPGSVTHETVLPGASQSLSRVNLYPAWLEPSSGSGTNETVLPGASQCLVRLICIHHGWNPLLGVGLMKQFSQVRHNV